MFNSKLLIKYMGDDVAVNTSRVNHPSYYLDETIYIEVEGARIPIECVNVIRNMPTWKGSAISYIWRAGAKPEEGMTATQKEIEDIKKAIWWLKDRLNALEH